MMTSKSRGASGGLPLVWLTHLPMPCFVLDKDARFAYVNEAFTKLSGYREKELRKLRFDTLFARAGSRRGLDTLLDLYQGRSVASAPHGLIRKNNKETNVLLDAMPAYEGGSKKVTHVFGFLVTQA
ncbi:MAG: PAS domain-containing protein [Patescibacteria group bacterium]|nr:MAG: PAS domain-containing protein [Patescibacteria group bacterium]